MNVTFFVCREIELHRPCYAPKRRMAAMVSHDMAIIVALVLEGVTPLLWKRNLLLCASIIAS
jgi:hypothetical protein